jgi:hypothetical protein
MMAAGGAMYLGLGCLRGFTLIPATSLVIMGMVIAGLLLALYMPIFQLSSVLT